jgi:predicted nucleic acid-binding protein
MRVKVFLDTNVFIYFYSDNELEKRSVVVDILDKYDCITSTQALCEASNVWYKKSNWTGQKIKEHLDNITLVCNKIATIQRNIIDQALLLKDKYGYAYYDSLMLASALKNDCSILFSEDMSNRQRINGKLDIINPFK